MPSDNKKAKAAAKKQINKKKPITKKVDETIIVNGNNVENSLKINERKIEIVEKINGDRSDDDFVGSEDEDTAKMAALAEEIESLNLLSESVAKNRSVTGHLSSQKESRDLHYGMLSITFHGQELLQDANLELNNGRRYGLIGTNGCGKSTLLAVLANEEVFVPKHIDHFLLQREMPPSDKTALACVMEVDGERVRLEEEAEHLALIDSEDCQERLMEVYERLDELESDVAEKRAGEILHGLGFTREMQNKQVKHFSGGWRMRISLARALFLKPALLMLDEPTNHLDLNACVWLENELAKYKRILVIISHSQDFLNGVCTNIIQFAQKKLTIFGGNYDTYLNTKLELDENQMKKFKSEQSQIANFKEFIARFGHGTKKMARQAQSREKQMKRMVEGGLTSKVQKDKNMAFAFPECGYIPPPVIQIQNVSFSYGENKTLIYDNLDFGVDLDTRVALVGPNGAGKSTLLKLIAAEIEPTEGMIRRHSHVKIGRYHQHLQEIIDVNMTALDWMMKTFPAVKERDDMRKKLGRYGLSGTQQTCPIKSLSDGQRCRIVFAYIAETKPHMLLLDEPTNHLDLETIDALADALNDFDGGMLLVSHDFRLIGQVADEIWVCEHGKVTKWEGDIYSYKKFLTKTIDKNDKLEASRK